LGYPVVYLLRHDNVAQAVRALTNADVQVVSVECRCLPLGPSATAFTLTACSAPCDLCPEGGQDAVWTSWASRAKDEASRQKHLFSDVAVASHVHPAGKPVAL